jgi:hypothetical protein
MADSAQKHSDPAHNWLIFFFVCFTMTVGAIGFWAFTSYHVDDMQMNMPVPATGEAHH